MPLAGNIAKTMTSNGKQFTVTRKKLTAVACDQRWPDIVTGKSLTGFFKICFCFVLLYNESLNDWDSGFSGNKILFPSGPEIKIL